MVNPARLVPAAAVVITFVLVAVSPVSYAGSDSYGTLVLSQNLIRRGTLILDADRDYFIEPDGTLRHSVGTVNGHLRFRYPLGASLLSAPAVAAANLLGFDMRGSERLFQKLLSALIAALVVALLWRIGLARHGPLPAALLALLGFFGTVVAPTIGGALWSMNFSVLFMGVAVWLLLQLERQPAQQRIALALGVVLFLGYLSRPTFAAFILPVFGYLWITDRRALGTSAAASGLLFVIFTAWHWRTYGHVLPPEYVATGFDLSQLRFSLSAMLLSPSRSLIIWNPFLLVLPFLAWASWRGRSGARLAHPVLGAATLLLLVQAGFSVWWGGWSYGPRIATEMVFLFLIGTILGCRPADPAPVGRRAFAALMAAFVLGAMVNLRGLYSPSTQYWNGYPPVDQHPVPLVFDWRFPQFLANRDAVVRKYEVQSRELGLIADQFVPYQGRIAELLAGTARERTVRFQAGGSHQRFYARVVAVGMGFDTLRAWLNDSVVGEYALGAAASPLVPLPERLVHYQAENALRLEFQTGGGRRNALLGAFTIRQY